MSHRNGGFALIEIVVGTSIVGLLLAVLLPAAARVRNADGFQVSMQNLSLIMRATQQYHADHAGRVPMRGSSYSNGLLSGWDSWSVGGKNCGTGSSFVGQIFDEPAHSRFLNPYLYQARIPKPTGYINTGSGPTWNFAHGTPTVQQRTNLEIPVFKSPGDVASIQGPPYGVPNPNITSYNDVGTSYHANMKWWDAIPPTGSFTQRYDSGVQRINQAFNGANPNYVFLHDQTGDRAVFSGSGVTGEFGKRNASMMGFADGRVAYLPVLPTVTSGPGYTFVP